jgi:chromate reductase, NAD(P)H dehydrogenase (quinone)
MTDKIKKILAISGSTRKTSTNLNLLRAIALLYKNEIKLAIFESIATLPQFNPDDTDAPIPEVMQLRKGIRDADAVIICTPEYAHGVPGALKNVIDWTVSTNEFSHKPTALITASTDGRFGHAALLETLRTIEAGHVDQLNLLIPFAKTKIGGDNIIKDASTLAAIKQLIDDLLQKIDAMPANEL